jgi:hypothetical protein
MNKNHFYCCICGKELLTNCGICTSCSKNIHSSKELAQYNSENEIFAPPELAQNLYALYERYFSRPEVQAAYEAYQQKLSDEPSQSSSRGSGGDKS